MSVLLLTEEDVRRIFREELRAALELRPRGTEDRRVTATEAAAAAGVSPATLRQWATDGKVRRYGEGRNQRFSLAEVLAVRPAEAPLTPGQRVDAIYRRHHG